MNKKGFAISIIMYSILIMFIMLLVSIMGVLASRKMLLDKSKKDVISFLNAQESTITATSETNEVEYGEYNPLPGKFFETESTSIECTINGIVYDNTDSLEEGEYTVKCAIKYEEIEYASATTVIKMVNNSFEYTKDFIYNGEYEEWIVPKTGYYQVEAWGAQGGSGAYNGNAGTEYGGLGAYTSGIILLNKNEKFYVYIGGQGSNATSASQYAYVTGGYNGGAKGAPGGSDDQAGGGGGSTDIRYFGDYTPTTSDLLSNSALGLNSRIMVAAGGGGGHSYTSSAYGNNRTILPAINGGAISVTGRLGYWQGGIWTPTVNQISGGSFGVGGYYASLSGTHGAGGGGGGYYGGVYRTDGNGGPGSGGTSYVSGHIGCVAIANSELTNQPRTVRNDQSGALCTMSSALNDVTCSYHYSNKIFKYIEIKSGGSSMSTHDGTSTMTGNSGNGYLKITYVNSLLTYETGTIFEYTYTGAYQKFDVLKTGKYKIELWGAQGGSGACNGNAGTEYGGLGAYTSGTITLEKEDELYIYVGGSGANATSASQYAYVAGGYNGGAKGAPGGSDDQAAGGGGATDVRYFDDYTPTPADIANNSTLGLNSRIMVAAGGGGGHSYTSSAYGNNRTVLAAVNGGTISVTGNLGYWQGGVWTPTVNQTSGSSFGIGGYYASLSGVHGAGGGGGGYYGGVHRTDGNGGPGSGGTSYISGYTGCNAITSSSDRTHTGQPNHYSGKVFTQTEMKAGNESMPNYDNSSTMIGNSGNGYAKITYLGR